MTRTEIIAACCVQLSRKREAEELRKTAIAMMEMGYYTVADYNRFCEANGLEVF